MTEISDLKHNLDSLSREAKDLGMPVVSMLIGAAAECLANEIAGQSMRLGHAAMKAGLGAKRRAGAPSGSVADVSTPKGLRPLGRDPETPRR